MRALVTELVVSHKAERRIETFELPILKPATIPVWMGEDLSLSARMAAFESRCIRDALAQAGGSVTAAARLLKLSRATLHRKVSALGISR